MAVESFGNTIYGVMWTQVALAAVFIAMRMYTRHFLIKSLGWDDVLMIVNFGTFVGYVACTTVGVMYGVGRKRATVDPADYSKALMWEAIGQGICIMGIGASKGSVAVFLLRIVILKWHKAVLWFCIVSTSILCTITTTLLFVQCKPTAFLWDQTIAGGYCRFDFTPVGLSMGSWSATMDFVLAILPWHVIMGLNMKRKEKLTVAIGLSLGVFAGICSVVRTYELQSLASFEEYIYDTVGMLLWSSTEVFASIICACIPVLRPLYVKIVHGSQYGWGSDGTPSPMYPLNQYNHGKKNINDGGRVYAGTGGNLGAGVQTRVRMGSDNVSEESMLREDKGKFGSGGIRRTDELQITSTAV